MKRQLDAVPEEPNMALNEGVVSGRVLKAHKKASARLTDLDIPHVVVGGLAVGAWGHPRATKDVDFLVRARDAFRGTLVMSFKPGVPIEIDGVSIDYLTVESLKLRGKGKKLPSGEVVPIEVLFAMKLKAKRMQDDADVVALVKRGADLTRILAWLHAHGSREERLRLVRLVAAARVEKD